VFFAQPEDHYKAAAGRCCLPRVQHKTSDKRQILPQHKTSDKIHILLRKSRHIRLSDNSGRGDNLGTSEYIS